MAAKSWPFWLLSILSTYAILSICYFTPRQSRTTKIDVSDFVNTSYFLNSADPAKATPIRTTRALSDAALVPFRGGGGGGENDEQRKYEEPVPVFLPEEVRKIESCTGLLSNSKSWLKDKRLGNVDDPLMGHPDFLQRMIADLPYTLTRSGGTRELLGRSLCHERSRLVNDDKQDLSTNNSRSVRMWAVRLAYLAIHYHQHRLAIPEARARVDDGIKCDQEMRDYAIGRFDYECPDAKYLVVSMGGFGLGVNIRTAAAGALMLGVATDRIALFLNNVPGKNTNAKKKDKMLFGRWTLVSCERGDFQCFFLPPSPCTLTKGQLENAYFLNTTESQDLVAGKTLPLPEEHENDKVWVVRSTMIVQNLVYNGASKTALKRLGGYIDTLISVVSPKDHRLPILRAGAQVVQTRDLPREGYQYLAASDKLHHAAVIYSMRPNFQAQAQLNSVMKEIVPENIKIETAIGLPIRASDKCKGESDCLSFDQHIEVATDFWGKHLNVTSRKEENPTILFTSESKKMVKDQLNFATNTTRQAQYRYKYNFLSNTHDVSPDSGFIKDIRFKELGISAGAMLMGAISSLKFQLLPRASIGNCCSNFHILINDFLMEGCGAASENTFFCLNQHENLALRTCCGWQRDCKKEKQKYLANMLTVNSSFQSA